MYYSNEIIIKNIIFLFLNFSEDIEDKKNGDNLIISKLFQLQSLIDDFNIKRFKQFPKIILWIMTMKVFTKVILKKNIVQ